MPGDETLEVQINAKAFPAPDGSKRPVLRDVAFSAGMGLILAFFGPSGMGKSTILRIAAGLDADFEGFVRRPPGREDQDPVCNCQGLVQLVGSE